VERLVASQHVGEPQLDEANAALLDGSQYVLSLALPYAPFSHLPVRRTFGPQQRNPPHSRGGFVHVLSVEQPLLRGSLLAAACFAGVFLAATFFAGVFLALAAAHTVSVISRATT